MSFEDFNIRCESCGEEIKSPKWWQRYCSDKECQKVRIRLSCYMWRQKHPGYHVKYNKEYKKRYG